MYLYKSFNILTYYFKKKYLRDIFSTVKKNFKAKKKPWFEFYCIKSKRSPVKICKWSCPKTEGWLVHTVSTALGLTANQVTCWRTFPAGGFELTLLQTDTVCFLDFTGLRSRRLLIVSCLIYLGRWGIFNSFFLCLFRFILLYDLLFLLF